MEREEFGLFAMYCHIYVTVNSRPEVDQHKCIARVHALYYITVMAVHLLNCSYLSFRNSVWKWKISLSCVAAAAI